MLALALPAASGYAVWLKFRLWLVRAVEKRQRTQLEEMRKENEALRLMHRAAIRQLMREEDKDWPEELETE